MKSQKCKTNIINVAPRKLAMMKFSNVEVFTPGIELAAHVTENPPIVTWEFKPGLLYALLLINADAIKLNRNFTQSQICRWLIVNIPEGNIEQGRTINDYMRPQQTVGGAETERCLLLIFKQNSSINADKFIFEINKDGCICVQAFDCLNIHNLGTLVAGNYYKINFSK